MGKIFAYIAFGMEVAGGVEQIILLVAAGPLTGVALFAAVQPALVGLHGIVPKVTVSDALALSICNAVAEAVNQVHHPKV